MTKISQHTLYTEHGKMDHGTHDEDIEHYSKRKSKLRMSIIRYSISVLLSVFGYRFFHDATFIPENKTMAQNSLIALVVVGIIGAIGLVGSILLYQHCNFMIKEAKSNQKS